MITVTIIGSSGNSMDWTAQLLERKDVMVSFYATYRVARVSNNAAVRIR